MPELIDKKRTEAKVFLIARHFIDRPDREVELVRAVIHRCCEEIDKQPTIEAEPVRHGRWIDKGEYAVCSECGGHSGTQYDGLEPIALMTRFCPDCGARMDAADDQVGGRG